MRSWKYSHTIGSGLLFASLAALPIGCDPGDRAGEPISSLATAAVPLSPLPGPGATNTLLSASPYGTNLVTNPSGESGSMDGWTVTSNGGLGWTVVGAPEEGFHTSYEWARRHQVIDLYEKGFNAATMARAPAIYVSELVRRRYCADEYFVRVELLDTNMQLVDVWDTGIQNTGGPCDWIIDWQQVEHTFTDYGPNVRYVRFMDGGKDTEWWWGHFGAVFSDAVVMVMPPPRPDTFTNLLVNPDAERGDLSGWQILENGGNGWAVGGEPGHRRFMTSYAWARRSQLVDLYAHGFDAAAMAKSPMILVREDFRRTYCPDEFYLKVELLDEQMVPVAQWDSGVRNTGGPCVESDSAPVQLSHVFTHYPPGVRYVRWEDGGKDSEWWWGHFGTQLDNATLVVYSDNLLTNPGADTGDLAGWQILENGGAGYTLPNIGVGGSPAVLTSYGWFRRTQTVDLVAKGYSAGELDLAPTVYVSELFGRRYCPDNFYLKVELLRQDMSVLAAWDSGVQTHVGPCDWSEQWQRLSHVFQNYGPGLRYIRWEDGGKDTEWWAGNYGAVLESAFLGLTHGSGEPVVLHGLNQHEQAGANRGAEE